VTSKSLWCRIIWYIVREKYMTNLFHAKGQDKIRFYATCIFISTNFLQFWFLKRLKNPLGWPYALQGSSRISVRDPRPVATGEFGHSAPLIFCDPPNFVVPRAICFKNKKNKNPAPLKMYFSTRNLKTWLRAWGRPWVKSYRFLQLWDISFI